MNLKYPLFICSIFALTLLGASCSLATKQGDGGVFRTGDYGVTWQQRVFVAQAKKRAILIDNVDVAQIYFSPANGKTLFAVSLSEGVFQSDTEGGQWRQVAGGPIGSFAPHPTKVDVLYVATGNRLLRSQDGGAKWQTLYIENTPQVALIQVEVDPKLPSRLYLSTSKGAVLRSIDEGVTWQLVHSFNDHLVNLAVNPHQTNVLYAGFTSGNLWRSIDYGQNWVQLDPPQVDGKSIRFGAYRVFAFAPDQADGFVYASQYGLTRSSDGGQTWAVLKLVTPVNSVAITGLALDSKTSQNIFYVAGSAYYRTIDGGRTWETLRLPSSRIPTALTVDPNNGSVFYLGVTKPKKK